MPRPIFHTAGPGWALSQRAPTGLSLSHRGSGRICIRWSPNELTCTGRDWDFYSAGHQSVSRPRPSFHSSDSREALSRRAPVLLSYCGPRQGPQLAVPSQTFIGQAPPGPQSVGPVRASYGGLRLDPQKAGPNRAGFRWRALAGLSYGGPRPSVRFVRHCRALIR